MKRTITVKDGDKVVYEGPEQRLPVQGDVVFGLPKSDWIKFLTYAGMLVVFLVRTDNRLQAVEKTTQRLTEVSDRMQTYMESADGWHSTVTGTQFKGGRPLDANFDAKRLRNVLNGEGNNAS